MPCSWDPGILEQVCSPQPLQNRRRTIWDQPHCLVLSVNVSSCSPSGISGKPQLQKIFTKATLKHKFDSLPLHNSLVTSSLLLDSKSLKSLFQEVPQVPSCSRPTAAPGELPPCSDKLSSALMMCDKGVR